jgi:hypothetical protein
MPDDLELLIRTRVEDPLEGALVRVANLLGTSVETDSDGLRGVRVDGLLVYGVVPDEEDRRIARRIFDLDSNLTLVFVDLSADGGESMIRVQQNIMRVVLGMVADASTGVLIEDYSPGAIVLAFTDGRVTLNQDWDGWRLWPEVLEVFPSPHHLESLRGQE